MLITFESITNDSKNTLDNKFQLIYNIKKNNNNIPINVTLISTLFYDSVNIHASADDKQYKSLPGTKVKMKRKLVS